MLIALLLTAESLPCTKPDGALPASLSSWTRPGRALSVGKAVTLEVAGVRPGSEPVGTSSIGFRIQQAGTYVIALDQPGWIDVTSDRGVEPMVWGRHGNGPACTSIRQIVTYELKPGSYRLKLTKLAKARARVMLATGGW